MQWVGRYMLSANAQPCGIGAMASQLFDTVTSWLDSKGTASAPDAPRGRILLSYPNGRQAQLQSSRLKSEVGELLKWQLDEPIDQGTFRTRIEIAHADTRLSVDIALEVGTDGLIAPLKIEARCPQVVRRILEFPWRWMVGEWQLPASEQPFTGGERGADFIRLLEDPERTVPLIAISQHEDALWPDDFVSALRSDVVAIATIAELDAGASWELTNRIGRHWSCYNGALRIYWPRWDTRQDPRNHPLWTQERIARTHEDPDESYRMLRRQIRVRFMRLSTLGLKRDSVFDRVLLAYREETRARSSDDKTLANIYASENDELREQNGNLVERILRLETDLENAIATRTWEREQDDADVQPDSDAPPATIREVLVKARERFASTLAFGESVDEAVEDLDDDAGPPAKVFEYFVGLDELARTLRDGPLGKDIVTWLRERGYAVSGESETTRKRGGRAWRVNGVRHEFDLHLKPTEGTNPARCVRIYFRWDAATGAVLVGWFGRHLD